MKLNNASSARTIRGTFIRWPLMEQSYKVVVIAYFKVPASIMCEKTAVFLIKISLYFWQHFFKALEL